MVNQVSSPENLIWNCPSRQQIVRVQNNIASQADLDDRMTSLQKRFLPPRRTELVLELSDPSMLRFFSDRSGFGPRIRILVSDNQIAEIHKRRSQFIVVRPILVLNRCEGSLPRTIQFLASLNLPIEVNPTVFLDQDKETLLDLAERLLFSPFVKTPVQPFFNLLLSAIGSPVNSSPTLWDICNECVGHNFFITNDGKITLSSRWAEINRFFGDISDTIHNIRSSPFFSQLKSMKSPKSAENSKCSQCRVLSFCSGYLCALDSTHDCSPFQSVYDFMSSHSRSLKESYMALPKHKKHEVFQTIEMPNPNR